jgi:predicted GTPase
MDLIKQKNIEDMRKQIDSFKILSEKKMFLNVNYNSININFANFVLFGPSGSGKSSFIRTLFKSLYAVKTLPPDVIDKLIIKNSYENEGTLNFIKMILKEQTGESTGIRICDTRGHILMNKEENEQFKLIVEGKVKDNSHVVQSDFRNPLLLWEFWKNEENIFSDDILEKNSPSINHIPHSVILVFDGSSEDIISPVDVEFYRNLVSYCITKSYSDVHVILTRVDILEEMAFKKKGHNNSRDNIQNMIHTIKDQQIEKVIESLGVKRSNVHFIENYLSEKYSNSTEIDFHVLKTLSDIINSAEQFLLMNFNRNTSCFSRCI